MRIDRSENGRINIRDIQDDMGSGSTLNLLLGEDGDVVLTLRNPDVEDILRRARAGVGQEISIEFCTFHGGGHNPLLARELRKLVMLLVEK